MVGYLEAAVVGNEPLPRDNFMLSVHAPEVAQSSLPGQFVMAAPLADQSLPWPLLKRALAVYSTGEVEGRRAVVRFLVKKLGDGTRALASLRPGDAVSMIGPLGRGFDLQASAGKTHFLLAGGIGIASVYLLAEELSKAGQQVHLIYGGRSSADLVCIEDFRRLGIAVVPVTEDGSAGVRGLITDGLRDYWKPFSARRLAFYACGPNPMMKAVSELAAERGVPCQISVETRMGCGFGVCLGCTVKTVDSYKLACRHGPVFDARQFIWESDRRVVEISRPGL